MRTRDVKAPLTREQKIGYFLLVMTVVITLLINIGFCLPEIRLSLPEKLIYTGMLWILPIVIIACLLYFIEEDWAT